MTVLRENSNSLMAMLEAFLYDPLVNWKLLERLRFKEKERQAARRGNKRDNDRKHRDRSDRRAEREGSSNNSNNNNNNPNSTGEGNNSKTSSTSQGNSSRDRGGDRERRRGERDRDRSGSLSSAAEDEEGDQSPEARTVIRRVQSKLRGTDFFDEDEEDAEVLDVPAQVQRLLLAATSRINLCQSYMGWCPFW